MLLPMASADITVYPKNYAHGFVVLCFAVVMQSFIMNSREVFIHIHQGCFAGTGAIVRLPQCQWSKPDGYGKISQCITTTKHSKAKTVCIFLGIYCILTIIKICWDLFIRSNFNITTCALLVLLRFILQCFFYVVQQLTHSNLHSLSVEVKWIIVTTTVGNKGRVAMGIQTLNLSP